MGVRLHPRLLHHCSYVTNLFVRCQTQQYGNGHNHIQNFVMVIITLNPAQVTSAQFGQTVLLLKLKIS